MKSRIRIALATLVMVCAVPALADREQRSIEASANGNVSVQNVAGSIEITGWSRNEVEVLADLGRDVEELVVERDGDNVVVKVKAPKSGRRSVSSDLVLRVPENSSIDVGGVSAGIEVSDVFGEQRLHVVSGDIVTEAYEADILAEAVSGDIEITGDSRPMFTQASTVSGSVETTGLAGDAELSSVSGDVVVTNASFSRAQADTVSGDIAFRAEMLDGSRLDMETINGDIDLHFEGSIEARFDIETFNGAIRNCFGPKPVRTSKYTPGQELKFKEGNGSARVTLRTLNGSLRMCRD
jgi:DUF4097 and DUF4098 domain-containing protein YvlB